MKTIDLLKIYHVQRRSIVNGNEGIQRELNHRRSNQISEYLTDPDATFPTSIILSIESNRVAFEKLETIDNPEIFKMVFNNQEIELAEVIDGQHRISGLENNPMAIEELPIVVLFDLSQEDKAYIFSVINSNQRQVNKSLIYDLFDVYEGRSPLKTCHQIAKALNTDAKSPLYMRLKMLGRKTSEAESISQGSFVSFFYVDW